MAVIGQFGRLTIQRLKLKRIHPTATEVAAPAEPGLPGTMNFALAANSGLLILIEDI